MKSYINIYLSYFIPPFSEIEYEIVKNIDNQILSKDQTRSGFDVSKERIYLDVFQKLNGRGIIKLRFYLPDEYIKDYLKKINLKRYDMINGIKLFDEESLKPIFQFEKERKSTFFRSTEAFTMEDELRLLNRKLVLWIDISYDSIVSPIIILFVLTVFSVTYLIVKMGKYSNHLAKEIEKVDDTICDFQGNVCGQKKESDIVEIDKTLDLLKNTYDLICHQIEELQNSNARIEELYSEIETLSNELRDAFFDFSQRLATVVEGYEQETSKHIKRTQVLTRMMVERLELPKEYKDEIVQYSTLHDIGKIFIPHEILNKNGKLTKEEFEEVKRHTVYAKRLLAHPRFKVALNIALFHHENYDGTGYPLGLSKDEIPLEARIVKIVDVYDALRSDRPYKKAFTHEEAIKIITNGDGRVEPSHFDPKLLEIFLSLSEQIMSLYNMTNNINILI
ncbi:MAG: HD-GYP domain-containing protein [Fervidobacterium sp.]